MCSLGSKNPEPVTFKKRSVFLWKILKIFFIQTGVVLEKLCFTKKTLQIRAGSKLSSRCQPLEIRYIINTKSSH